MAGGGGGRRSRPFSGDFSGEPGMGFEALLMGNTTMCSILDLVGRFGSNLSLKISRVFVNSKLGFFSN